MPYTFNPHQHVKIWISKNPDLFMNLENQMRLIKMRITNPKDPISLVYDSSRLNAQAIIDLKIFCEEQAITPFDIDKVDQTLLSDKELKLYKHYKNELSCLDEGGNLAVASDILRWISPVYNLGTYTDFDAPVDTSKAPSSLTVESPLLINLGSLILGEEELIFLNNDTIAVVDKEAAKASVEKIQQALLNALEHYDSDFIENCVNKIGQNKLIYKKIIEVLKNRKEIGYIKKSTDLNPQKMMSSLELRALINKATSSSKNFIEFNRTNNAESSSDIIKKLRANLAKELDIIKWLFFHKEYKEISSVLKQDDEKLVNYLMKKERSLYLKIIVLCTTGPVTVAKGLFGGNFLQKSQFKQEVEPLSFNVYKLDQVFKSPNTIALHENPLGMLKYLDREDGEVNDASWLEEGIALQKQRQNLLESQYISLITGLSDNLMGIKNEMKQKIFDLQRDQKSFFGKHYRKEARQAKIEAFEMLLNCFHEDSMTFNVNEFRTSLASIYLKKQDVFAALFTSHSQTLIEKLETLCTDAQLYRIPAKDILYYSKDTPPSHKP